MNTLIRTVVLTTGVLCTIAMAQPSTTQPPATQPATAPDEQPPPVALKLLNVNRLRPSFNPALGETAPIRFELSRPASVTLTIYGPNRELIAKVANSKSCQAGLNTVDWDGKDVDGNVVPDEAYTFDLKAIADDQSDLWDPLPTSGGERLTVGSLQTQDSNRLTYQVPKPARVLVRVAIVDGPLVRTLVNWKPRPTGLCIEYWNGMDEDGLRRAADISNLRIAVAAMALPDQSIIAIGNTEKSYRSYYLKKAQNRPHKPKTPRIKPQEGVMSPHWNIAPHLNGDPKLKVSLVGIDDLPTPTPVPTTQPATKPENSPKETNPSEGIADIRTSPVLVRVDIPDPIEREFMNNQKFELIIYVDDKRILEVEQGHVPFTYPWDITNLTPGRHILTINVSSFRNHVGTASRLVNIKR